MATKTTRTVMHKLAKAGAIAIGLVYALVGVVAILSLLNVKQGGATEAGILNYIANIPLGKVLLAVLFVALLAYIIWKFYNALVDPYGYGKNFKGWIKRGGVAAAGLAYGFIAYSAAQAFLGMAQNTHGTPYKQRELVAKILEWHAGEWLVAIVGVLVAITAIAQFLFVFRFGYKEKFKIDQLRKLKVMYIHFLAWGGHFARGIILLVIAWFLFKASFESDAFEIVNTDKAFNFLGEQIGHVAFVLVAAGTIIYGIYMFTLSYYYDFEDDYK